MTGAVDKYGMPFFGYLIGWYFVSISDLRDCCVLNAENSTRRRQEKQRKTDESFQITKMWTFHRFRQKNLFSSTSSEARQHAAFCSNADSGKRLK